MKPAPFRYVRPADLDSVLTVLAQYGDEAKVLAGGQSLVPMLNFRLARPAVIVDLGQVPDLDGIDTIADGVRIGALARQSVVRRSAIVRERLPLVAHAIGHIGHEAIRNRGTLGGSLVHADPAAELPAAAVALGARLEATGPNGQRTIDADDFFLGPYTTALADDEVLTAAVFPAPAPRPWAFEEIARTSGDFAIAGIAAARTGSDVRLVAFGLGSEPQRLAAAEAIVSEAGTARDIAAAAAQEIEPWSDIHADADYRRSAIATLVGRTLGRMSG